jgi:hypothetical protein
VVRELITRPIAAVAGLIERPVSSLRAATRAAGAIVELPDRLTELEELRERAERTEAELARTTARLHEVSAAATSPPPARESEPLGSMFARTAPDGEDAPEAGESEPASA